MKTYLLLAIIFVFSFTSCTNEDIEIKNIAIKNFSKTTDFVDPEVGQILKIIFENDVTNERMIEIRSLYFNDCYTSGSFSESQKTYYYSVKMYDAYPQNSHVEYWRVIFCENGRPGGIGGGMPDEVVIDY